MIRFEDKQGRLIEIDGDFDVEAFHDGVQIGLFQFDDRGWGPFLFIMNIDPAFQRAGIGVEMMRFAAALHGNNFGKPDPHAVGGRHADSCDYLTIEGAGLVWKCIQEEILAPYPEPNEDD